MTAPSPSAKRLGQGFYWQDISVGQQFETFRRTITETDLVNFISVSYTHLTLPTTSRV